MAERTPDGRFLTGHIGLKGSGRPSKHAQYQQWWDETFKKRDYIRAIWKLYGMALKGDVKSLTYFIERCMGKLTTPIEMEVEDNSNQAFIEEIRGMLEEVKAEQNNV